MKEFGLQIYSVRDRYTNKEDTRASFFALAEMGYKNVQTAGTYDYISAEDFKAAADAAGIEICGTHYSYDIMKSDVEKTVAYHKTLGTANIGLGGIHLPEYTVAAVEDFIKEFNAVAETYSKMGFKLTYHNHSHEFIKLEDGKTFFDHLIEGLNPETTSFVLDTYWCQHGGIDVRAMIERLAGRIDILHLKDMRYSKTSFDEVYVDADGKPKIRERWVTAPAICRIGEGNMNFRDIISLAEKCGVKYFVVEDDDAVNTGDSLAAVKKSADYIKANLI